MSPLVVAVLVGALAANTVGVSDRFVPGLRVVAKRGLRLGVALLGLQLSISQLREIGGAGLAVVALTVTLTFFGTRWIGRRLGLAEPLSLLVATGYSICGASAIAAVEEVSGATEDEVAYSVALVTACGSIAIVAMPLLRPLLGLDALDFGSWVGASVHDVGQVVAASTPAGAEAVQAALIVKLTRVILLAPLVTGVTLARRNRTGEPARLRTQRPPVLPLFVVGFLTAIVVRSVGVLPSSTLDALRTIQTFLLSAALFALGCGVRISNLRLAGGRPLALGAISWVLVLGAGLAGTQLVHR